MTSSRRAAVVLAAILTLSGALATVANAEVAVWDVAGSERARCPDIDVSDPKRPRGGCVVPVRGHGMTVTVRTLVGDIDFATCDYPHDLRVDGSGQTYMEDVYFNGPPPCNDMRPCMKDDPLPWRGRLEDAGDGRIEHVVDACFDTCMGVFRGELRLDFRQRRDFFSGRRFWLERASAELLGDSGLGLDGSWQLRSKTIDVTVGDG